MVKKKGLGKGLGAVFNESVENINSDRSKNVISININKIEPRDNQPRLYFSDEALEDLASSIKEFGVIQPLIVKDEGDYYSIIAGERRYRAARLAKLIEVPVIIKEYSDVEILEVALIENIQREDLNPLEEALCYERLMKDYYLTQKDISEKVSKSTSRISKIMSLLNLDKRVQELINTGKLNWTHGDALLVLEGDTQYEFADKIIEEDLGIREAKELIEKYLLKPFQDEPKQKKINYEIKSVEDELIKYFGTKVSIKNRKGNRGKIEISYNNMEELDRLIYKMSK